MAAGYRRILSIDPARRTGWAILDAKGRDVLRLVATGTLRQTGAAHVESFAAHMTRPKVRPDMAVIEDQYLGRRRQDGVVLKVLVEIRTRFSQALEARGVPVMLVMADDWQTSILSPVVGPETRRAERKRAAALYVRKWYSRELPEDENDAVALGTYAVRAGLGQRHAA